MSTPGTTPATGRTGGPDGANLMALRDHNAAAVLSRIRAGEGSSRVELAAATGLSAQAVSKIVLRLAEAGLIAEAGRGPSTGGKPRTLLRLVPEARRAVGVQLGRDALTVLLADLTGAPVAVRTVATDMRRPPGEVLEQLAAEVGLLLADVPRERVLGVGLACPGPLDQRAGVLHRVTGSPAWDGLPLRDLAAERLGLDVVIEKDTTAGVLSGLGSPERAFVSLGDGSDPGLGAGLVLGGRVQRGARTNAGEFGHQCVDPAGPRCACGSRGCLEALCAAAMAAGRPEEAARLLGVGVANLVRLLDLEQVILAGRAVLADPARYVAAVREELAERLPDPQWQQVSVEVAGAGVHAVALGAASLVLAKVFG